MISESIRNQRDHRGRGVVQGSPVSGGDHRVAYPTSYIHTRQPDDAATALLERIDVSAVAVPDGTRDILPNGDLGEDQPRVATAATGPVIRLANSALIGKR
jgi:hypothetical protein